MTKITSTEFQQNVGAYSDTALREPVFITSHGRERLVLMSADEYRRIEQLVYGELPKYRDTRKTLKTSELTEEDRELIKNAKYMQSS